jgi:hypothetical protein
MRKWAIKIAHLVEIGKAASKKSEKGLLAWGSISPTVLLGSIADACDEIKVRFFVPPSSSPLKILYPRPFYPSTLFYNDHFLMTFLSSSSSSCSSTNDSIEKFRARASIPFEGQKIRGHAQN